MTPKQKRNIKWLEQHCDCGDMLLSPNQWECVACRIADELKAIYQRRDEFQQVIERIEEVP